MTQPNPVVLGSLAGVPLIADIGPGISGPAVKVTLTAAYTMAFPPGWPTRPSLCGVEWVPNRSPVITPGTTFAFFKSEADALVAAGAASYA